MARNAHHTPRCLCNLEQIEMSRAGQNDRWLKSRVGNVTAALQESAIVGMKRDAKSLLGGSNLCISRRSERAISRNAHGVRRSRPTKRPQRRRPRGAAIATAIARRL